LPSLRDKQPRKFGASPRSNAHGTLTNGSHVDRLNRRGSVLSVDSKRSEEDDDSEEEETSQSQSFGFETASERAMQIQDIKRRMERFQLMASEDDVESFDRSSEALAKSEDDDDVEVGPTKHTKRVCSEKALGQSLVTNRIAVDRLKLHRTLVETRTNSRRLRRIRKDWLPVIRRARQRAHLHQQECRALNGQQD